jgi:sulfur carrier protein
MQLKAATRTRIVVNGEPADTHAGTLAELVAQLGFTENAVATALNGEFVARTQRAGKRLATGDKVEIVAPRQGG